MLIGTASAFAGGDGSVGNPYQISTLQQLQNMNFDLSAHYILINDIDATPTSTWNSGEGWRPIGNFTAPFTGTFDGSGYTIDGLYINNVESNQGMFGFVRGGHIHDVGVTNASISGHTHSGILLGSGTSGTEISNVHVSGTVTGLTTASSIGGIAGRLEDSTISDSNGYTTVHVPTYIGGGLVGTGYSLVMQRCYAVSTITGSNIGGLVGRVSGTSTATSSYYDIDVSGVASNGFGEPKTTAQMQTQSTFTGWGFYDTWRMSGYPMLYSQLSDDFYLYPGNDTISKIAPPLLHSVTLDMFRKGAVSYDILIATDDLYTNVAYNSNQLSSGTLANYSILVSLEARTYYMQVEALDSSGNTIDTATSTFTISQTIDLGSTSVAGNIYEIISGVNTPISNVKVTLYNDTVSYDYITSSNGYYQFIGLANSTTYNMVAVKNGYEDSTLNVFTSVNGSTVTKNILMQKEEAPTYIMPHYVRFTVRSLLGGVYEGVLVTVYEGNSATPLFTQTTGSDGAVGFELSENIRYRLTLYSESDNINTVYRVTPTKNEYNIYVSLTGSSHQGDAGLILYGMHIDGNELNVTWQDTSGLTSLVEVTIKNRDDSIAYYLNSTDSDGFLLQDVNTTENLTYIVELKVHSGGLDETFIRTHILTFESGVRPAFDLGFSASWQSAFLASLSLIFLAVIFGSGNAHVGAILVSLGGLFHIFVTGWIPASELTVAMAFIGVIVSVVFYMRKGEAVR